jgi:hypothetical protein
MVRELKDVVVKAAAEMKKQRSSVRTAS